LASIGFPQNLQLSEVGIGWIKEFGVAEAN
jgi:hypothetical protein